MKLNEFINTKRKGLDNFHDYWVENAYDNGAYPSVLTEGEWEEQLYMFLENKQIEGKV